MKLLVIDGNSIVNRAFYGVSQTLCNSEGQATGAIYGFISILNKLRREESPDALCITFDLKAPTFRHLAYADYKGKRKKMPEELASQMPILKDVLSAMNIPCYSMEGWEADDLIGTIAKINESQNWETVIVTGDKDSLQLVTEKTRVNLISTRMGQTTTKKMTPALFEEMYGFPAVHIIDLKAFMGDSSDNIPGIQGIGEKTIIPVIQSLHNLDAIYEKLQDPEETLGLKPAMLKRVRQGEDMARMSLDLATIRRDVPLDFTPEANLIQEVDAAALTPLLQELELYKLMDQYDLNPVETIPEALDISSTEEVTALNRAKELLTLWESLDFISLLPLPSLAGVAVHWLKDGSASCALFLENAMADYGDFLKSLFTAPCKIATHQSKALTLQLLEEGITPSNIFFDIEVAAYLLAPESRDYELESLAKKYCKFTPESAEIYRGEESFSPLSDRSAALSVWAKHSGLITLFAEDFIEKLEVLGLSTLYNTIEQPLCSVLAKIQQNGIAVDRQALIQYGEKLSLRLKELESEIHQEAGEVFNINSTQQLGHILFEKMELPPVKKTKTGYSTNVEVLEKLREDHPDCKILALIMEQRQLSKLQSTYATGLLKVMTPQSKIHTKLQNTVTTTGRLSSTEPNLQNIPIRTPLGAELRDMFVAEEGMVLIDADYSQIELRLLAHMAEDPTMIESFLSGEDIHSQTASQVFHVPLEEVTSEMRRSAKAVNFGIVYGISAFSLSQDIGVTVAEAKNYISRYFATYPQVEAYLKELVENGKKTGFVTTMYGRRRWIPELKSSNFHNRGFGERIAQNTPIQGSAADIIKLAMVAVSRALEKDFPQATIVLQVHDELLVQCPEADGQAVAELLQREMEGVAKLSVPLSADTHIGKSWGEAH